MTDTTPVTQKPKGPKVKKKEKEIRCVQDINGRINKVITRAFWSSQGWLFL
jgi:hypothetical protein